MTSLTEIPGGRSATGRSDSHASMRATVGASTMPAACHAASLYRKVAGRSRTWVPSDEGRIGPYASRAAS